MKDDAMKMLRQVASGEVSVEDARDALDGISLSEEAYETAIEHGVFNEALPVLLLGPASLLREIHG